METKLGLKENWQQFSLLVIVNAFVGGMVGLERSIIPQLAETEFGLSSKSAILSFIVVFGIAKAITNYFTGRLANKIGRRNLLIFGWILALPIPFFIIYASSWAWIIIANLLLGISQGLTWSSTVVMKMDLVGEKQRGLAMGINEFAGYLAVGIVAFLTGYIAEKYGVRPYPFYFGIVISILGLLLTVIWVKDTKNHVSQEAKNSKITTTDNVFLNTTFKDKTLSSVTQAGLVNNLNDGMIWGLLPILLIQLKLNNQNIGIIAAIYPTFWGIGQLFTGKMSDIHSKKKMLFVGMLVQGIAIVLLVFATDFYILALLSAILGVGTALVYPTFLSTIAQVTNPTQRAESVGTFRLWRDLGYAFGAIISGITADIFGIQYAIVIIGLITIISSVIIQVRMPNLKI
jgi:MFS family permease